MDGVHIPEVLVPFMGGITYLPFVRDSKLAPTIVEKPLTTATTAGGATEKKSEEKKAEKPAAVAPTPAPTTTASTDAVKTEAPTPTPAPAAAVAPVAEPLSPEAQAVADKIAATGEEIRKLKAAKVCLIYTHIHIHAYCMSS